MAEASRALAVRALLARVRDRLAQGLPLEEADATALASALSAFLEGEIDTLERALGLVSRNSYRAAWRRHDRDRAIQSYRTEWYATRQLDDAVAALLADFELHAQRRCHAGPKARRLQAIFAIGRPPMSRRQLRAVLADEI